MAAKLELLRDAYAEQGAAVQASPEFQAWFKDKAPWLKPYALYCPFRDLLGVADPAQWGSRASVSGGDIDALTSPKAMHYRSIGFWYFVQCVAGPRPGSFPCAVVSTACH